MLKFRKQYKLIAASLVAGLSVASGVPPAIGFLTAKGTVQLDAAPVAGHGTLFEGSTVETGVAGSQLQMPKDARVYLSSESRAKVFRDHLILEKGDSELSGSSHYWVQARGLRIGSLESSAGARISVRKDRQVLVTALGGPIRVSNAQGLAIAWVQEGKTLQLEPQENGGTPVTSRLTGCLQRVDGHYYLMDDVTGVKVELKGAALERQLGTQLTVTGVRNPSETPASDATQVINVTGVTQISKRCVVSAGGTAPAPAGSSAGGAGGISTTTAVIAGVAVAGGATALVVGLTRADAKASISQ